MSESHIEGYAILHNTASERKIYISKYVRCKTKNDNKSKMVMGIT